MNLLMSCFFGATLLLLAGVSLSSSATKIMVLLRKRTMFQVYCLFIFMSAIITFATFVVENLILWYGIYLAIVHFLFILSYSLVFDQEYPYRNFVKILLLLPFFIFLPLSLLIIPPPYSFVKRFHFVIKPKNAFKL